MESGMVEYYYPAGCRSPVSSLFAGPQGYSTQGVNEMSNFEKRFGKYAISNLSLILILCYVVGYVIQMVNGNFLLYLTLDPYAVLHGQI